VLEFSSNKWCICGAKIEAWKETPWKKGVLEENLKVGGKYSCM
jgi:hypothetical protein